MNEKERSLSMTLAHKEPHHITLTPRIIAEYCQVSKSTVIKWIKDEKLKSFRLPSGHYRIDWDDFKEFLEKHHMPLKEWFFESEIRSNRKGGEN